MKNKHSFNKRFWLLALQIAAFLFIFGALSQVYPEIGQAEDVSPEAEADLVFAQGNTLAVLSNPTNPPAKVVKTLPVVVTAYSSTVSQTDDTPLITASGSYVRDGIVANNLLPFGTKIRIPEVYGDRVFIVEDRMNRKKGYYHVDVWYPDYWQALSFGAKEATIEVLEG